MTVKVFRFHLTRPIENGEGVREQLRLAHEYHRTLIDIVRRERADLRALQTSHGNIAQLQEAAKLASAACEAAYDAIKRHKAKDRTRKVPAELRDAYSTAKEAKRQASSVLFAARTALRNDLSIQAKQDEVAARAVEERKRARAACGVYWGTYLRVEAAVDAASKSTPLWDGLEPSDPWYPRRNDGGELAVQVQGGTPASDTLDGSDRRLRIEPHHLPAGSDPTSRRSAKRAAYDKMFWLRIGSTSVREPIWAKWRMVMHRPFPDGAVIKQASVHLRKVGPWDEWYATITIDIPDIRAISSPETRVAVDIGWRVVDGGIRVATWLDTEGNGGHLVLDDRVIGAFRKSREIQSVRSKSFDVAIATLISDIAPLQLPDWFPTNLGQWKSQGRLASLRYRWARNRFPGDDLALANLSDWERQDRHLWEWETGAKETGHRLRKEVYRRFAAQLARKYGRVVLDKFDLTDVARRPTADAQADDIAQARANRQQVAPSDVRLALLNAFRGHSYVPTEFSTKTCAKCKSVEEWDQAREVDHTCSKCGSHWDQDKNKCSNLLSFEWSGGSDGDGPARDGQNASNGAEVKESRWTKAKRMAAEKKRRIAAARTAGSEAAE